jgi:hypothetical protein
VLTHSGQRAYEYGWNYLEIYNADIVGLPSVIHYAHAAGAILANANSYCDSYPISQPSTATSRGALKSR